MRFDHYVDDAKRWAQKLRADVRFDSVTVLGHSEGALIGMLATQGDSSAAYISLAGTGRPADVVLREQLEKQSMFTLYQAAPILNKLGALNIKQTDISIFSVFTA